MSQKSDQKKTSSSKRKSIFGDLPTVRFWAIFAPIVFVYLANSYWHALREVPAYRASCGKAYLSKTMDSTQPCYYEPATARLSNYYDSRNRIDSQDIVLTFPDNRTGSMQIGDRRSFSDPWFPADLVDGNCLAEIWHGHVSAIIKDNRKIYSNFNPQSVASGSGGYFLLAAFVYMVYSWIGLITLLRDARRERAASARN